jgi:transcription-repair coupling factor (superfamily II helicase)
VRELVWEQASRKLQQSSTYRLLLSRLGEASSAPTSAVRLPLAAAAWVAELAAEELGRTILAVVPGEADALAWIEAAELFGDPRRGEALFFPAPSLSPYQEADPSLHVRAQEAVALDALGQGRARVVVTTPRALFRRLPSLAQLAATGTALAAGQDWAMDDLAARLVALGFRRADLVTEVGDFAVRGGVFDLFPPGEEQPVRLDFFGDTIETLRRFDPVSQRSEEAVREVRLLPLSLFPAGEAAATRLADRLAQRFGQEAHRGELAERIGELRANAAYPGWENLLPWASGAEQGLADLLEGALVVAVDVETLTTEARHHAEVLANERAARQAHGRAVLEPDELELPLERVLATFATAQLAVGDLITTQAGESVDFQGSVTDVFAGQLPRFPREVEVARARGERCLVIAGDGVRERVAELLEGRDLELGAGGVEIVAGELGRGFRLPAAGVALYSEQQLLPRRAPVARSAKARFGPFVSGLRDLKVGDFVVHADHGIGQFVGLRNVGGDGSSRQNLPPELAVLFPPEAPTEVMELSYASGKRLLVPLARIDLIQKFSGIEGVAPRLDQLGGTSWNKTKSRIKKSLRDMAEELLKLYAARQVAVAPAMGPDTDRVRQVEAAFVHDETPDQLDAIAAIKTDLEREKPMDRLLCGDVGYGKTEVAMRAAFKAVDNGYQVAVLAPTTILADQHLETFRRRFEGFPVTIEMISRFRSPAEVKDIGKRLADGKIDILIGTHRLLSRDLQFASLGLLIVDEEQRFGVAQKEKLKQLKQNVHVLAMSATPVPRTLQLSLAGVRDLSVIETPPKNRMAVETAVVPYTNELVREAIEFELERGGQVYFVYNRVESIEWMLAELKALVPQARITVGHGQLDEDELYRRMHAFTQGDFDILLASTIIENGIDIPNVNTMIVHRADRFGLSQLYQLRGRVGRSDQLAYCYLLVERDQVLSEMARKRLSAIREFTDLGAGFRIAARDLEIRGAGNLLGAEQSGHINAVGLETYLKMLEETIAELRGEKPVEEGPSTAIDLPVPMAIPTDYIADANLRMEIYRKIAAAEASEAELASELADRFGDPPAAVHSLLRVGGLKRLAERLRVQSISAKKGELVIRMRLDARIDIERLIELVSSQPGASFSPAGALTLPTAGGDLVAVARETLERIQMRASEERAA